MPRAPRGKRVLSAETGSFIVAGRAPKGQPAPYFDRSRKLMTWWLDRVARHRVRGTTFATYREQLPQVDEKIGGVTVRTLRPEQVTALISDLVEPPSHSPSGTQNWVATPTGSTSRTLQRRGSGPDRRDRGQQSRPRCAWRTHIDAGGRG